MRRRSQSAHPQRRSSQAGYAYLMALGLVLLMIAASLAALSNLRIEAQRQREADMIWRGQQYTRAIRLYFHKTGHYPQTKDDLMKGLPDLHFLRQEYKDPMNKSDGSWRYIYINAAGQIIGSVKYANLQQMALLEMGAGRLPGVAGLGTPASNAGNSGSSIVAFSEQTGPAGSSPGGPGASVPGSPSEQSGQGANPGVANSPGGFPSQNPNPQAGQNQGAPLQQPGSGSVFGQSGQFGPSSQFGQPGQFGPGGQPGQVGGQGSGVFGSFSLSSSSSQTGNPLLDVKPTGPVDGPVVGGFLTGVASKVDSKSVKWYKGGKKYKDWEFIWNPLIEQVQAAQQLLNNGGAGQAGGQPGQAIGSAFGNFGGVFGNPGGASPGAGSPGINPGQPQPQPQPPPPQSPLN
jgi:hypothetical protein